MEVGEEVGFDKGKRGGVVGFRLARETGDDLSVDGGVW
jgi:hypothetical protein